MSWGSCQVVASRRFELLSPAGCKPPGTSLPGCVGWRLEPLLGGEQWQRRAASGRKGEAGDPPCRLAGRPRRVPRPARREAETGRPAAAKGSRPPIHHPGEGSLERRTALARTTTGASRDRANSALPLRLCAPAAALRPSSVLPLQLRVTSPALALTPPTRVSASGILARPLAGPPPRQRPAGVALAAAPHSLSRHVSGEFGGPGDPSPSPRQIVLDSPTPRRPDGNALTGDG